ncbi:MAG TPA: glycerophosphodiester phosphodiesterase family protein [Dermatophilaceae bacterium]|nr:glycerophosphodiester phosphodiesterase family protein [Dermatophilaceae bacterium]
MPDAMARPGPWASGVFDVEGHRGARGLVPENILPSFLAAFEAGVTGVELDVRLTADGQVVVWHDPTLQPDKCRSDRGLVGARVDELTLAQLQTVDVGSLTLPAFPRQQPAPGARIATLAGLLADCADPAPDVWWTIELKVDPTDPRERGTRRQLVEGVLQAIHDGGIEERCFVHSFDWAVLDLARELDPTLLRSALAVVGHTYHEGSEWLGSIRWEDHGPDLAAAAAALGAQVVSPHFLTCDRPFVERAHELGLGVLPWTVNEPEDLRRMVEVGVDGLVTDYPDLAVSLLRGG